MNNVKKKKKIIIYRFGLTHMNQTSLIQADPFMSQGLQNQTRNTFDISFNRQFIKKIELKQRWIHAFKISNLLFKPNTIEIELSWIKMQVNLINGFVGLTRTFEHPLLWKSNLGNNFIYLLYVLKMKFSFFLEKNQNYNTLNFLCRIHPYF